MKNLIPVIILLLLLSACDERLAMFPNSALLIEKELAGAFLTNQPVGLHDLIADMWKVKNSKVRRLELDDVLYFGLELRRSRLAKANIVVSKGNLFVSSRNSVLQVAESLKDAKQVFAKEAFEGNRLLEIKADGQGGVSALTESSWYPYKQNEPIIKNDHSLSSKMIYNNFQYGIKYNFEDEIPFVAVRQSDMDGNLINSYFENINAKLPAEHRGKGLTLGKVLVTNDSIYAQVASNNYLMKSELDNPEEVEIIEYGSDLLKKWLAGNLTDWRNIQSRDGAYLSWGGYYDLGRFFLKTRINYQGLFVYTLSVLNSKLETEKVYYLVSVEDLGYNTLEMTELRDGEVLACIFARSLTDHEAMDRQFFVSLKVNESKPR